MVKQISILILVSAAVLLVAISCGGGNGDDMVEIKSKFAYSPTYYLYKSSEVKFADQSTASGSSITSWSWHFGDGSSSSSQNPSHVFAAAGEYTVALAVKDDAGNENVYSQKLRVIDPVSGVHRLFNHANDTVFVAAHRSLHSSLSNIEVAENSMTAIKEAINAKIDLVEMDVRRSSDGVLVLMHDATIDRTTTGTGAVNATTYSNLSKVKLKTYRSGAITTDTIPVFKDVLEFCKNKIFIVIDIDENKSPVSEVLNIVKERGMLDNVIFFTSSLNDIGYLMLNGAVAMPSCYNNTTFSTYLLQSKLKPLLFQTDNNGTSEEWISMKNNNIRIYTNNYLLTAKNPVTDSWSELETSLSNNVNIVQTDYPVEMISYLKTKKRH
jgi:glycerophosphoryl diester phosphodiesterase